MDRFTKGTLAVIAAALVAIAIQGAIPRAAAQTEGCGATWENPCYVASDPRQPVWVTSQPKEPVWVEIVR